MRNLLYLLVLTAGLAGISGCAGVVKSPAEIGYTYQQVLEMDARQLTDDWNYLWLADRQYRLTKWYTR